ncbi:aminotransferase class III-fold pyridoxal phosphate-dependent enzyme [Streptomyces sp. NBC_00091]|uniref:aminotransferase class III-fold pyridoxal phosphate-dependent enzyme n=1 Tax=Streptomyces sp. NBC_00091 TaxID=2975648 RepID=UPI00225ADF32|nr:aminotransferase class III-fold pyridoxal phosphate-dependent enzyme [Streptomyces sp. NBC_00091]MCX5379747.1 aminotransferase class III-fold pyridoxal phosphate-dependent enzyme [Streptomyces sp. NBC_00091]
MNDTTHGRFPASEKLLARAERVIPGGVWGHNKFPAVYDPTEYPWFAERGEGARLKDVDGNWYVDFMCGYGTMVNGYARPEVDDAVMEQARSGDCLSQATARSVELAELLVDTVDGAAWAAWGKGGSDATWIALLTARAHTGRTMVACVDGAYHGSHGWCAWCNPGEGRRPSDSHDVTTLRWNDVAGVEQLFAEHGPRLAAVVITPFHHPIAGTAVMPDPAWLRALREHCDRAGTLLISDDVRAGFHLDLRGSHAYFGFRPDLVAFSKALANGWPVAAVTGTEALREAAAGIFVAGTYWNSGSSMAGAIANLRLMKEERSVERMHASGGKLVAGLLSLGELNGVPLRVSGPVTMPTVTVDGDQDFAWMRRFAVHMAAEGSFVHPMHNWFVSAAHDDEVIEQSLDHAARAIVRAQEDLGGA